VSSPVKPAEDATGQIEGGGESFAATLAESSLRSRIALAHSFEWVSAVGLAVALGVLMVIISVESPFFLTHGNFINIGRAMTYDGVVAAIMTLVLVCGELDLSVGAVIALGGIASAETLNSGYNGLLAILVGLLVGLACGLVNAGLIVRLNVNPLICTIGTQFAFYGVAYIWSSGNSVNAFGFSDFSFLGNGTIDGVYYCTILMFVLYIACGFVLGKTRYGSQIYTIGGSRIAARRVGIKVDRIRTSVYLLSGVAAALGGIIVVSADGSASATFGTTDPLIIISAVIIGGTALVGGRGNLIGTFLGIAFLGVLQNGMDLLSIQSYWQEFIEGIVLVSAITIDEQFRRRRQRGE
jgi:ribose transport system permease protein